MFDFLFGISIGTIIMAAPLEEMLSQSPAWVKEKLIFSEIQRKLDRYEIGMKRLQDLGYKYQSLSPIDSARAQRNGEA